MCMGATPFQSSQYNLGEQLIGKNTFRAVDPLMGQAERTAGTWWEQSLDKKFGQQTPGAQPAIQAAYAPDTNSVLRQRKTAVNSGAFSSLLPAGPSISSGTSLLGG